MNLDHDIILNESAFVTASSEMLALKGRTSTLRNDLATLYAELKLALNTPAGEQVEFTATNVLLKPIDDLLLVIDHTSKTLDQIRGSGYYKDVFVKYEELNNSIK